MSGPSKGDSTTEACHICGNARDNRRHIAKETGLGLQTEFIYLECAACGCLQQPSIPCDISTYYPPDYYSLGLPVMPRSLAQRTKQFLRTIRNRSYSEKSSVIGRILEARNPHSVFRFFWELHPALDSNILDVGCGSGSLLLDLHDLGFKNVLGIDPFIKKDIRYENGVRVLKRYLSDLTTTNWDVIMFHHSFEHVSNPVETLQYVANALSSRGKCLIRIPVISWAWEQYGINWAQLDAPRHLFLHTEKSLRLVAQQAGLAVRRTEYDSDEFQFWGSELAMRNIPISSVNQNTLKHLFRNCELREYRKRSKELNQQRRGDQAVFYLSRTES